MSEYDELEEITEDIAAEDGTTSSLEGSAESSTGGGATASAPDFVGPIYKRLFEGMPAPFFNPNASKEYYRFFFGGLLMLIGCFMPFDSDWTHVGYKTVAGAVCLLIALGVMWSAWISINIPTMVRMKWYLLASIPFVWALLHLIFLPKGMSWGDLSSTFSNIKGGSLSDLGNFFQRIGPGKIFICLGGLMVEFTFLGGIFGGAKQMKAEKSQGRRR